MKRFGCLVLLLCSVLWFANRTHAQEIAQQTPAAVISDPPPDPAYPATMASPDIPSHGAKMYSVLYVASGAGPHPTVLLLHGFPGNEKNLDLAYSIRRAGWNVLVPFDRGAWGSGGTFSFTHTLEDAQASIDFLLQPENVKKFRIDPNHLVLIGHSMGGFVAAYATAHEPKVFGTAMIAAWNLAPASARQRTNDPEFWERWNDNASRLVGTTGQQLIHPNVVGLVYIAGFGLDEGESIGGLLQQGPPTPGVGNINVDSKGFGWVPEDGFLGHFAADIDPVKAKVMYAVQQPLHISTFDDVMGTPAWKSLPSWYLVAQNDQVIPPDAERQFAQRMGADTIEVASGHCAMVSHPEETYERIVTAANAAAVPGHGSAPSSGASPGLAPWKAAASHPKPRGYNDRRESAVMAGSPG